MTFDELKQAIIGCIKDHYAHHKDGEPMRRNVVFRKMLKGKAPGQPPTPKEIEKALTELKNDGITIEKKGAKVFLAPQPEAQSTTATAASSVEKAERPGEVTQLSTTVVPMPPSSNP